MSPTLLQGGLQPKCFRTCSPVGSFLLELRKCSMKWLVPLLLGACLCHATPPSDETNHYQWLTYKKRHSRLYSQREDQEHRGHFLANLKMIQDHNAQYDQGLQTYQLAVNQFADMSFEEVTTKYLGYHGTPKMSARKFANHSVATKLPKSLDWRTKGVVTRVKDQGHCGSCWAFSATGALEGQHARKTGKLVSLSEQNLLDCSSHLGNLGCTGGDMVDAFQYVVENRGIATEKAYPYEEKNDTCRYKKSMRGTTCKDYVELPEGDELALQKALVEIGPISVSIDVTDKFIFYRRGVFNDRSCESTTVNHAVLLVGYGKQRNKDYWLVKNSWGKQWGRRGYIRMARNKNNHCGIATDSSYPVI